MNRLEARKQALEISAFVLRRMAFDNPANLHLPNDIALIAEEMTKIAEQIEAQVDCQNSDDLFISLCENSGRL
ncbi:MAG: hypothetical protein SNJ55_08210 [Chloroherpetonaceae bacterium]